MDRMALGSLLFAILVVVGMAVPAVALSADGDESTSGLAGASHEVRTQPGDPAEAQTEAAAQTQTDARVNAAVGPQLSTVIDVSSDEVQTEVDDTAFELAVERADDDARADAIADRADELRDRAEAIRDDYEDATEAYEDGELSRDEYARRIAVLNARATNLEQSYEQLRQRAATVSEAELEAAGVETKSLNDSVENLSRVTGTGAAALLKQFTGEADGEIELEFANGLSIEVENEDGERYREFERAGDGSARVTLSQVDALETARTVLSAVEGEWVLTGSEIDESDGVYEFAFELRNASAQTGEAEVSVDGSSGEVVSLEEAIERRGEDEEVEAEDEGGDEEEGDRELTIVVAEGTPGPNEQITVQVLSDGEPVAGVPVSVNDRVVGQTDSEGRLVLVLPATDKVEISAETDEDAAELEFEFDGVEEEEDEDEETETETPEESEDEDEEVETETSDDADDGDD